jgi:pimeloyl-ACP methyl ester carboxylesterase
VQYETYGLDGLEKGSPEVAAASHRSAVGLVHAARRILTQHDAVALEHLTSIDVPTLVIVGSDDRPFLASSEYMSRKIPGAHHVVIDGAGHAPMLTHPEVFQREVGSFLEQLPAT